MPLCEKLKRTYSSNRSPCCLLHNCCSSQELLVNKKALFISNRLTYASRFHQTLNHFTGKPFLFCFDQHLFLKLKYDRFALYSIKTDVTHVLVSLARRQSRHAEVMRDKSGNLEAENSPQASIWISLCCW